MLTSQLLLLEANMRLKQQKIDSLLNHRDRVISQQQERIRALEKELSVWRKDQAPSPQHRPDSLDLTGCSSSVALQHPATSKQPASDVVLLACQDGDDSLDDSDSAVVIEDGPGHHSPTFKEQDPRNTQVRLIIQLIS